MVWKHQDDFSTSDREADLFLRWPRGGRDDFEYDVLRISDGQWVFSFSFDVLSTKEASEEIKLAYPGHNYVTSYAVVRDDLTDEQIEIIRNILYAHTNGSNGFSFQRNGVWEKSAVEILFTDSIGGR